MTENTSPATAKTSEPQAPASRPYSSYPKQAVIVLHGMGEQKPMDTLRGFVRTVWERDADITANGLPDPAEIWSKPDLCRFRQKSATHSDLKPATDSDLKSATGSDPSRPPVPI